MYVSARHARSKCSSVGRELRLALQWWAEVRLEYVTLWNVVRAVFAFDWQVLELDISEERSFEETCEPTGHLFTDARSTPPHIAAVLFM